MSKPRDGKGEREYLGRGSNYRFFIVDRNDRSGLLFVDYGGSILDKFLGFSGGLDTTSFSRLRSRGRDLLLFLHGDGSRGRGDLGFSCSRWSVTGRVNFFRFRRGVIYIVDVSSPIGLGGSLVDSGPLAVDDIFVQHLFPPGNSNGSGESSWTLAETNGTRPLFGGRKKF